MFPNDEFRPHDDPGSGTIPPSTGYNPSSYQADSQPADGYNPNSYQAGGQPVNGYNAGGGYSAGGPSTGAWNGSPYADPNPAPPPKPKKAKVKKGLTAPRVVALCLVCALLGGCVSGGAFALLSTSRSQEAANTSASTTTVLQSDRTVTTNVETTQVAAGEEMTVSQIYAAYSGSVVCIEVSTANATGAGTGFVITPDGYIVTCYHVIDGATDIAVTFSDSTSYEAALVGGDEDSDVAVLKIDAADLTPVVLGNSSLLQVGDTVTTIGNALGTLANTTTTGVVSALDRAITMSDGTVMNVLQTDCTVNSGNSGGPLFNAYGEVIGIVNAKYSSAGSYSSAATIEGIGFAIPYADVENKIADLMEYGYITGKPSLGITVSTVSALDAQRYNMVVGAYVNSVVQGSCAEAAGLQQGDIITGVDGESITTYEELVNAKNKHSAGDEMTLEVNRDGEVLTITVILDEDIPDTSDSTETSGTTDPNESYSDQYGQSYNGMTPEDFFNYFFGGSHSGGNYGGW